MLQLYSSSLGHQKKFSSLYAFACCTLIFLSGGLQIPVGFGTLESGIFFLVLAIFIVGVSIRDLKYISKILLFLVALTTIQFMGGVDVESMQRVVFGVFLFAFAIVFSYKVLKRCSYDNYDSLFKMVRIFIYVQLALQFIEIIHPIGSQARYHHYFLPIIRPPGFAYEPSAFGRFMVPFMFLSIVFPRKFNEKMGKTCHVAFWFSVFLCPTATVFADIILIFMMSALIKRKIKSIIFYSVVIVTLSLSGYFFVESISSRILPFIMVISDPSVVNSSIGLSSLAFMHGAVMAYAGLTNFPWGVGLLNMNSLVPFAQDLLGTTGDILNENDGTSLLFKGVCELGFLFLILYAYSFFRCIKAGYRASVSDSYIIESMFLFAFIAQAIRGATYFDGSHIFGLALLVMSFVIGKQRQPHSILDQSARGALAETRGEDGKSLSQA